MKLFLIDGFQLHSTMSKHTRICYWITCPVNKFIRYSNIRNINGSIDQRNAIDNMLSDNFPILHFSSRRPLFDLIIGNTNSSKYIIYSIAVCRRVLQTNRDNNRKRALQTYYHDLGRILSPFSILSEETSNYWYIFLGEPVIRVLVIILKSMYCKLKGYNERAFYLL